MSFLKAEWRKLAFANYEVAPSVLEKYIPPGTELDLWEGKCFVSLIGFIFLDTKILGIKVPFHGTVEEVNLRFYVRRFENNTWKRGAVFIKEIVSKPVLTFVANTIYKEHYETMPMKYKWEENNTNRSVAYYWRKNKIWQSFKITAALEKTIIEKNSETEFITEHYWGYAKVNDSVTNEYQVTHPRWKQYKVESFEINVDFELIYGRDFEFLNHIKPLSIMLIEGSKITIEGKKTIKIKAI
ncbi:YqjF family protein [Polaribacter sp. IC073]|uniref:YqjF family protein n=1 Tax=Polaribacter sp. IC073 TaxID=2508540 RepID=UPI0011BDB351|nr:DUF2071 domain-containing protein [Polaribacter sp. IC073]TXD48349.1 DUF2071 domain-containing protein [Polaribacter sp. IC073]